MGPGMLERPRLESRVVNRTDDLKRCSGPHTPKPNVKELSAGHAAGVTGVRADNVWCDVWQVVGLFCGLPVEL